jgi:hypothetical protein
VAVTREPVTVKPVLAVLPELGSVAVMVVLPMATVVAKPLVPAALLIVATPVEEEDQVTVVVRSCVVASVYVPVAVNCCISPRALELLAGVIASETSSAALTVKLVFADTPDPE